jgi:arsenate reductase
MKMILYGIPNCDTVKKARTWLSEQGHAFDFHDFKKQGLTRELVALWLDQVDWEVLVNRKGTTWRKLTDERRAQVVDKASALELMLENPSVIKRPVLDNGGHFAVGFAPDQYRAILQASGA